MIADFVSNFIFDWISALGYLGILFFMALESAALPVPSEIVMPFAGYLAYLGKFDMFLVVAMGTIGNLLGSVVAYYVGLLGGRPLIKRYGKYFLVHEKKLVLAERFFGAHGDKAVLVSRMLPIVRTFISIPAGIGKMNFKRFLIYTAIGSAPWSLLLACLGFALGPNWKDVIGFFNQLDILIILAIIMVSAYYLKPSAFRRKK
ncbi:MAG: DedA family protein [Candidatus Aenigmatarchaeota archaeon]